MKNLKKNNKSCGCVENQRFSSNANKNVANYEPEYKANDNHYNRYPIYSDDSSSEYQLTEYIPSDSEENYFVENYVIESESDEDIQYKPTIISKSKYKCDCKTKCKCKEIKKKCNYKPNCLCKKCEPNEKCKDKCKEKQNIEICEDVKNKEYKVICKNIDCDEEPNCPKVKCGCCCWYFHSGHYYKCSHIPAECKIEKCDQQENVIYNECSKCTKKIKTKCTKSKDCNDKCKGKKDKQEVIYNCDEDKKFTKTICKMNKDCDIECDKFIFYKREKAKCVLHTLRKDGCEQKYWVCYPPKI